MTADARERLRTTSLRRRVVLSVLALLAVLLIVLGLAVDLALRDRLRGELEQRLLDRAGLAAALVDEVEPEDLVERLRGEGVSAILVTDDGESFGTLDDDPARDDAAVEDDEGPGPPGPGPGGGPGGPLPPPGGVGDGTVVETGSVLSVTRELGDGANVTLAADSGDVEATLSQLRTVLLLTSLAVLAVAALALGTVVRTALAPLDRMTAVAHSITAGDRGRRLRPDRPGTELGRTAGAFDGMLDELEGAERRARDAEVRVREFVSDAAHELRTPVAGVQAAAEAMLRTDPPRAERERLAVTVVREARRAASLVEDMLAMARIDRGVELQLAPTDLRAVATTAAERARLRHARSRVVVSGPSVRVSADDDRLGQVLGNLIDNAARMSPAGGTVRVGLSISAGQALVDVRDDGPGIPDGDRERVFERLVRLDSARDRDHGGAGLGLPIARGIARAHGGELVAMPSTGGAWFRLSLPVLAAGS